MKKRRKIQLAVEVTGAQLVARIVGPKAVVPPGPTPARVKAKAADHLSPEQRSENARKAGRASMAKQCPTDEALKERGAMLVRSRAVHALLQKTEFVQKLQAAEQVNLGQKPAEIQPVDHAFVFERFVKLPRTGSQKDKTRTFLKVLFRVAPGLQNCGYGFEGHVLRPGDVIPEKLLRPTETYPPQPICLECAGPIGDQKETLYVLWRYEGRLWVEIARARSRTFDWAIDIRPLAVRALSEQGYPIRKLLDPEQLAQLAARITELLDKEIAAIDPEFVNAVLCVAHDGIAARLAATGGDGKHATASVITVRAERQ